MFKGANCKRINYFLTSCLRGLSFVGLIISYIVVKITVKPTIFWLDILLLCLALACLLSAISSLMLCGFTATAYNEFVWVQIVNFVFTLLTGGVLSSVLCGIATFAKIGKDEIDSERIFNVKGHNKELRDETKKRKN